jgi:hypothetical protein
MIGDNPFEMTKEYIEQIKSQLVMGRDQSDMSIIAIKMVNVFEKHPDGPEVLAFLLKELKYGSKISHPVEMALYNVAVGILDIMKIAKQGDTEAHIEYSMKQGE